MLSIYFITNLLTIFFLFIGIGTLTDKSQKNYLQFKLYTLYASVLMLAQLLYSVFAIGSLRNVSDFNFFLDILNFRLNFGFEGFTVIFCFLSALLIFICVILVWDKKHFFEQSMCLFLIQLFVVAAFTVKDLFFFYVFFEAIVLPMYVLITKYGSRNRKVRAANLLLFYTLVSSALMLIVIGNIYYTFGTTSFEVLLSDDGLKSLPQQTQNIFWIIFFVSFATKMPLPPFHTWLPEAHVEASTPGSVLLAGILLKLGVYGLIVFCFNMLPSASFYFSPIIYTASVVGAVYSGVVAIRQQDLKRIIAYSSVSHMSVVTMGIFSLQTVGLEAGLFQGISHGFISVALFCLVGFIYDRFGSRDVQKYSGLARLMPLYAIFLLFFSLANLAMPGFSSFVGEFGLLFAAFGQSSIAGVVILTTVIFVGGYALLLNNRVLFGDLNKLNLELLRDIESREVIISAFLGFFVIFFGVYGELITTLFADDVSQLLAELSRNIR